MYKSKRLEEKKLAEEKEKAELPKPKRKSKY